jgi:hypothetical protein
MFYTIHCRHVSIRLHFFIHAVLVPLLSELASPLKTASGGVATAGGAATANSCPTATAQHESTAGSVPRDRDVTRHGSRAASDGDDAPTAASPVAAATAVVA